MKKWIKRTSIGLFILVVLVIAVVNIGTSMMKFPDDKAQEFFSKNNFDGNIEQVDINGRSIKVVSEKALETDSILLIFVHGAPGSWDAFKDYIVDEEINSRAHVVSYDRPGYGPDVEGAMPSIQAQKDVLKTIVNLNKQKKIVLVGHSYGGSIVGLASLDSDIGVDAAIMIAPLIDPVSEPIFWYSYFSYWDLTSWMLPSDLVVAGAEKFAHSDELDMIKGNWKNAKSKFIHVHGLQDMLAPGKENIAFSKHQISPQYLETIVYDEKGHLLIWTDYNIMKEIILKTLSEI